MWARQQQAVSDAARNELDLILVTIVSGAAYYAVALCKSRYSFPTYLRAITKPLESMSIPLESVSMPS